MAVPKRVTVPIRLSLSEGAFEIIARDFPTNPIGEVLESRCNFFVDSFAHGGFVLTPDNVTSIETNYGKSVTGPRDVVKATEKAASREDGRDVYSFSIDPVYTAPMLERAEQIGRTPGELMAEAVEFSLENHWLMNLDFDGKRRIFTRDQEAFFVDFTDVKDFTISDIITACKTRGKRKVELPKELPEPVSA